MAKRPRRAPPARSPGNPDFSAPQRAKPRALKTLLKTSQNFPPRFPLIFPSPAPKVLHKNPVTGKRAKKENAENAAWAAGESAGCPGHQREGNGEELRAPARQGWAGAAGAENRRQRNDTGGPGVPRTPGRRPPHRNGGTFGSFSYERTTIIREVGKKMATKPTRQLTNKATPARPIKKKAAFAARWGAGFPGHQRKGHGDAGRAAPRLRWGAAAPAENRRQRIDTGGPGVLRTPGRRPPHRNGGTFGSFSHERTTIMRYVGKKMTSEVNPITNLQGKPR